jgi:hypothetical protein
MGQFPPWRRTQILAMQRHRRAQDQQIGSGHCLKAPFIFQLAHPRHADAAIKPNHELGAEIESAMLADNETHEVRRAIG